MPARPRTSPALLAAAIGVGVVLAALGPGSCALSCYTAPATVHEVFEVCGAGDVEACADTTRSQYYGEVLAHDLPALAARCGGPVTFDVRGINVSVDAPYDWKVTIPGTPRSGSCDLANAEIRLVGQPWQWKVDLVHEPKH
jgi:hypothetical protein